MRNATAVLAVLEEEEGPGADRRLGALFLAAWFVFWPVWDLARRATLRYSPLARELDRQLRAIGIHPPGL